MTAAHSAAPIRPTDRVSDVLARDERLVDVFVRHASHFEKLRQPALRRVMARLVSVEQAARMAGVPVDDLLRDLNRAIGAQSNIAQAGIAAPTAGDTGETVSCAHHPVGWPTIELDLRDDMRSGREPFSRIIAAVGALHDDRVLRLRTIFEPVPLFAVLARRGLVHESRQNAPDDWSVWFWRAAPSVDRAVAERPDEPRSKHEGPQPETWLDVRGLEPPEPMVRTLAALEKLPVGHQLVQVNVRVPQLLLPVLAERGYSWTVDESHTDRVLVRIRRSERA